MAQYDLKVIQGTENLIIKTLPQELSYTVEQHKNVTIIKFNSTKDISEYANIITGLSITDQKTSVKLDYREWRVNKVAAGINPSLACVLCQIAEIHDTDSVLDPFCGASVIPISALLYYKARVAIASDISNYAFNSSRKNSEILNLGEKLIIIKSDVSSLKLGKGSVDKIITNPPFGIRTGNHLQNKLIYENFEKNAKHWLKSNGLLVILTQEVSLTKELFSSSFTQVADYPLFHNGLRPHIMVFAPKPQTTL